MKIDPHVHCRDGREVYKETIAHTFALCDEQEVSIIFDMPNTNPPILTEADVEARLKLVPTSARERYRLYIGASTDERQVREAARLASQHPAVAGIKLYACRSIGTLAVTQPEDQKRFYERLTAEGYTGVLAVHCEKESLFTKAFLPDKPQTHARARPPAAEIESVKDQIAFAQSSGFKGTLHICHVTLMDSLDLIAHARQVMSITCAVTPHHLLWSNTQAQGAAGLLYKVNPPLRDVHDTVRLRKALKEGLINWIETDHAPHPISEKMYPPYLSGYPSLCLYRQLVTEVLPSWGIPEAMIQQLTCDNIKAVFGERVLP